MKHNHLTACDSVPHSTNSEKAANGDLHDSEAAKEECSTKEDDDGKAVVSESHPPASDPVINDNTPTTSTAGSLQFYQGGKLVLKLQARKEEETYRWVKIKEWDPPQQPKRRKRYRKKLPKDRGKTKSDAFSSTDSEEESKVKAKPKSFLLHRFRASSSRHKDRLSPYSRSKTVNNESKSSTSDHHHLSQNGSTDAAHLAQISSISNSNRSTDKNNQAFNYSGGVESDKAYEQSSKCDTAGYGGRTAMSRASPLLSNMISSHSSHVNGLSSMSNGGYHGPKLGWPNSSTSSTNNNNTVASSSRISNTLMLPSHKSILTQSDPRHFAVSPMSQSSRLYPQVCTVPRQYLPSFCSPPIYQVPRLYHSTSDAPLDLSLKTMKTP